MMAKINRIFKKQTSAKTTSKTLGGRSDGVNSQKVSGISALISSIKSAATRLFAIRNISSLNQKIIPAFKKYLNLLLSFLEKLVPQRIKNLNSNYKIALSLTAFLALWMISGMLFSKIPEEIDASARNNNNIKSVLIREFFNSPTERIVRLSGVSREERMVEIKAELSAQVEQINFQEGSEVTTNTSILKLEQDEALARLRQAQSQENQARLEHASQQRLRGQELTSDANVAQAQANFEAAKASASLAQKQFDATEVRAPFPGRIERVYVEQGDFVQPGRLLASVFDYDPIIVVGDLSELEVNLVKTGDRVVVKFITGEELEGNVSYVAKTADKQSRTFEVQVSVLNKDGALLSGITAEMDFYTGSIKATKIPASIININEDGKIGVRGVDQNNKVLFYPIKVVKAETNEMWVSDVPEGAKIIVRGFGFVDEDEVVDVKLEEQADEQIN